MIMSSNVKIYFILNNELTNEINESAKAHYKIDCIELHNIEKKSSHPSIAGMAEISKQIKEYMQKN